MTTKHLKTLTVIIFLLLGATLTKAQTGPYGYYNDPVMLLMPQVTGTARVQGMAGSQTALGGDISSIAGNPAGLGLIKHSQATISPSLLFGGSSSSFINKTTDGFNSNFNIGNVGLVISGAKDDMEEGAWRGGSFSLGLTRLSNYNTQFEYRDVNTAKISVDPSTGIRNSSNSYIDYVNKLATLNSIDTNVHAAGANYFYGNPSSGQINPVQAQIYQAYIANIIDKSPPPGAFRPANLFGAYFGRIIPLGDVKQSVSVKSSGSQNQFDFAYGGNYNDQFYFGGSLGIAYFNNQQDITYSETQVNQRDSLYFSKSLFDQYKNYTINKTVSTNLSGQGVNLKAGIIYRPQPWVRVGTNLQTPTLYNIKETREFFQSTTFPSKPGTVFPDDNLAMFKSQFNYQLLTPFKWNGGLALTIKKTAIITLDADYLAYNNSYLRGGNGDLDADNDAIKAQYQSVINLRGGAEIRTGNMAFRAGYAKAASPYQNQSKANYYNNGNISYTGGFGFQTPDFFIDMAVVYTTWKQVNAALDYDGNYAPKANITLNTTSIVVTTGLKF
jgi:hypothetical protein